MNQIFTQGLISSIDCFALPRYWSSISGEAPRYKYEITKTVILLLNIWEEIIGLHFALLQY